MAPLKLSAWRRDRDRSNALTQELRPCLICAFFILIASLVLFVCAGSFTWCKPQQGMSRTERTQLDNEASSTSLTFDCFESVQVGPVVAQQVEKVRYPFFISIADFGTIEKPNRNFQRILKGKLFQRPAISETVQNVLGKLKESGFSRGRSSLVVDVGANVGMATFAAAAMGYHVLALEPVLENVQKLCDGVYLNRVSSLVELYHLAASDYPGNITMHKVVGRLDNSAVSATGAKLAFKSNEVVPMSLRAVALDSVLPSSRSVLLLKIDVQGWEYHVLKGASKLLSRPPNEAPYIIYEEDERLLQESNSTSGQILHFLARHGYNFCLKQGGDRHCTKQKL